MTIQYLTGDGRDVIANLADGSVDLVASSPPFFALRSYLQDEHDDKHNEMGSEPTPADYLDNLLECTALWARVLAPHGSIAIELDPRNRALLEPRMAEVKRALHGVKPEMPGQLSLI